MAIRTFTFLLVLCISIWSYSQTALHVVDGNNVSTHISTGAVFFNNPTISNPSYEYPAGSSNHLIFATSFWFGGEDVNGQLKLSGQKYTLGQDMFPGPLAENTANITPSIAAQYDQIWKVTKAEVDYHIQNYSSGTYTMPASILNWPAHGDVAENQDFYLAPFVDVNANGIYDPDNGDYPLIRGDFAWYMILNDNLDVHAESGGDALGIECHFMFYQYSDTTFLNNTTFLNLKVINRSTVTYSDFRVGCFMDPDLGDASDDLMGCDSSANVMYAYNGSNNDGDYGVDPPAVGVTSLNKDLETVISYGSTGPTGTPTLASEYWLNMQGYFKDGTHITEGGSGYGGTTHTNFHYHGNPNNGTEWSEYGETNPSGDRRVAMSIQPEFLGPGDEICYDFAYIIGDGSDFLGNVNNLLSVASEAKTFYDNQTNFLCEDYETTLSNEIQEELQLDIYPNPSNGDFIIELPGEFDVEIYNMNGQLIYSSQKLMNKGYIDVNLSPSNYILKVTQDNQIISKRITIL